MVGQVEVSQQRLQLRQKVSQLIRVHGEAVSHSCSGQQGQNLADCHLGC